MKILVIVIGLLVVSISALASQTIPEVGSVTLDQTAGCGVPARPGGPAPICPTVTIVSFVASTIGICDEFSAKVNQVNGANVLTIFKTTLTGNCTRPEHAPSYEVQKLTLSEELPQGGVMLANPLLINVQYRQ